jgi:hypothetical protein
MSQPAEPMVHYYGEGDAKRQALRYPTLSRALDRYDAGESLSQTIESVLPIESVLH